MHAVEKTRISLNVRILGKRQGGRENGVMGWVVLKQEIKANTFFLELWHNWTKEDVITELKNVYLNIKECIFCVQDSMKNT